MRPEFNHPEGIGLSLILPEAQEGGSAVPSPLLRRSEELLASAGRLVGAPLSLWVEDGPHPASLLSADACRVCPQRAEHAAGACRGWIKQTAFAAAATGRTVEGGCPGGSATLMAFPLTGGDRGAALLCLSRPGREGRNRRRRAFLQDLAGSLADQLYLHGQVGRLTGELTTRNEELRMLSAVAGGFTGSDGLRPSLRRMLEDARATVGADAALLSLGAGRLHEVLVRPDASARPGSDRRYWGRIASFLRRRLDDSAAGYYSGVPWDAAESPGIERPPIQAMAVSVPAKDGPPGVLCLLQCDARRSFRSSDIKLLQLLARQVALAVHNGELYEDLKEFLMATVKSLVGAIEAKDSYTCGHSERVNLISMLLGRHLGLNPAEMETLRWASILHDVGKIGMPEHLLIKPGRLTPAEYEIVKEHPDRGYRLLAPIRQLRAAAEVLRAHHEMIDGQGYPLGLRGEEIPLLARIIAVADTYDALTSTRAYRSARSLDYALAEIARVRGSQLDVRVVDALLVMAPFLREHRVMIHSEEREGQDLEIDAEAA